MSTPTEQPAEPRRIGPPIPLAHLTRLAEHHGYRPPVEVTPRVWRYDRTVDRDLVGWVTVAATLTPGGWWAHLMIVDAHRHDSGRVLDDLGGALFLPGDSWRIDPVGHAATLAHVGETPDWATATAAPRVLHRWGPLERLKADR